MAEKAVVVFWLACATRLKVAVMKLVLQLGKTKEENEVPMRVIKLMRLSRISPREWSKIKGKFVAHDFECTREQIELLITGGISLDRKS